MISFVKGIIDDITEDGIVVESGSIGYNIFLPSSSAFQIGESVKIYTYLSVREDAMQLYGFLTKEERRMFKLLIGVSGIGPKGALGILSNLSVSELQMAVMAEDSKLIAKSPGIGPQPAKKLILELKDKVSEYSNIPAATVDSPSGTDTSDSFSEAVDALCTLGYSATEAHKAVSSAKALLSESAGTEEYNKMPLNQIN